MNPVTITFYGAAWWLHDNHSETRTQRRDRQKSCRRQAAPCKGALQWFGRRPLLHAHRQVDAASPANMHVPPATYAAQIPKPATSCHPVSWRRTTKHPHPKLKTVDLRPLGAAVHRHGETGRRMAVEVGS